MGSYNRLDKSIFCLTYVTTVLHILEKELDPTLDTYIGYSSTPLGYFDIVDFNLTLKENKK